MTRESIQVPDRPWLRQFYSQCQRNPSKTFIRDLDTGQEASHTEFLYEVLSHRERLRNELNPETRRRLQDPTEEVFIAIIARGGFDFAVLLFAIVTLGAVAVPLRSQVHPSEAHYFLSTCNASLITSSRRAASHAQALSSQLRIPHLSFSPSYNNQSPSRINFTLIPDTLSDQNIPYSPDRGFALLYTSGTTGPSKGVLSSNGAILAGMENYKDRLGLCPDDVWMHQMPSYWKGGFDFFLCAAYSGATVEFCGSVFSPEWFWERMRRGVQGNNNAFSANGKMESAGVEPITCFLGAPTGLAALKESLDAIESLEERDLALEGLNRLRVLLTGSVRVPDSIKDFWRELRRGKELVNMYGFSEAAGMLSMTDWRAERPIPTDNCGPYNPSMEVRVDENGEICVKGPLLMKRYLSSDPKVMENVFDAEGFYKTGDIGTVTSNSEIVIFGRASQDVIRFNCYKIHSADIEDPLRSYPNVSQAFVLGVPDPIWGQCVAALLLHKDTAEAQSLREVQLADLRYWLAVEHEDRLPAFKLPTLLRVVPQNEFKGLTDNGKPSKKKMEAVYFSSEEVQKGEVQVWDFKRKEHFPGDRPWDWEGRNRD